MTSRKRGFLHIYTGDGKGKTTAALGLVLRALGAGMQVLFVQFLKKGRFSEIKALSRFSPQIEIIQLGSGRFVRGRPGRGDIERARAGLQRALELAETGRFQMIVLDEANVAVSSGVLQLDDITAFLDRLPPGIEVVITGRNAPAALIERADLVSECRKIKHYYDQGVKARVGIEK